MYVLWKKIFFPYISRRIHINLIVGNCRLAPNRAADLKFLTKLFRDRLIIYVD